MADGFIVRRGGKGAEQALAPTITEVSKTETQIVFTIKNNDTSSAIILWEIGDTTPDANSLELAADTTSSNITVTGLTSGTAQVIYATANVTGKVKSNVTEKEITTVAIPAPTINLISTTTTSLTFTIKNNSALTRNVVYGLTSPPTTTTLSLAAGVTSSNQTISGLTNTTDFIIYAQADTSVIAEQAAQTLIPTPTITQVSKTTTSITFTVRNNSSKNGDVVYGLASPPVTTTVALNSNTTSANQTISGLADNTQFTVFAQAKVTGFADSAIASSTVTTDEILNYTAATGGTTNDYDSGGKRFRSHTFNSNGTFTVSTVGDAAGDRNKVDYLIIAGGGAGGNSGGGGGAGGYRTTNGTSGANSSAESKITVTAQGYSITIGAGGAGGTAKSVRGQNGNNSSALGITSTGGGGGSSAEAVGASGGSGGAGNGNTRSGVNAGQAGTANQGRNGGNGNSTTQDFLLGGGGGGASAVGGNGSGSTGGNGGNGLGNIIRTGSSETRAGGGGGGSGNVASGWTGGAGGSGGGGAGGARAVGSAATVNTGSGGGAGGFHAGVAYRTGGAGGSGIVVIRYEIAPN
jgi:hypothetical protein